MKKELLKLYFDHNSLVKQQLDSYNRFIERGLQEIVDRKGKIEPPNVDFYIKLGRIRVETPSYSEVKGGETKLFPIEAQMRDITYQGRAYLEMTMVRVVETEKGIREIPMDTDEVYIGDIPIMVKSIKCNLHGLSEEEQIEKGFDPLDPGGYFIINGTERVLIGMEDLVPNKILVTRDEDVTEARVFSVRDVFRSKATVTRSPDGIYYVDFPSSIPQVPFLVLLKALGLSDEEIEEEFSQYKETYNDYLINKEITENKYLKGDEGEQLDPVVYLAKRMAPNNPLQAQLNRFEYLINNHLLPHLGTTKDSYRIKAKYLITMAKRATLVHFKKIPEDDRDHYGNKRIKLAGELMEEVVSYAFRHLVKDIEYQITKATVRNRKILVNTVVRPHILTERITYHLSTGNWIAGQTGISQLLDRTSFAASLSHRRRIVSPLTKTHPHFKARDLHGTLYAKICPSETPEGQSTSLVKNLALMAEITTGDVDTDKIKQHLESMGVSLQNKGKVGVYIDGEYVGNYEDGEQLFKKLVRLRRDGILPSSINFHFRDYINEFNINTTKGRIRHPYIVVENGKPLLNTNILKRIKDGKMRWEHLVKTGIVEYLDAEEEENAFIAKSMDEVTEKHTHVEIEPSSIFGAVAGLLPYPEYNSSPRLTMASSMLKQSLGLYASNYNLRFDTKGYVMYYPQKPIASTAVYDALKLEKRAAGQNFVVAVMSYRGWNMADAVVINKSAIDRGLGRAVMFKTYQTEEAQYPGGYTDKITVPTHKVIGYKGDDAYKALDEDGVAKVEAEVKEGDVIIGKISPPRFMEELSIFGIVDEKMRDTSVQLKEGEHGRVDKVVITSGSSGNKLIKVRVRMNKIPEIGDKFSSRHGQKGVIGMVLPQEDMPFTKDGIVPDLIINPHAIPSRMTAGHLLEMLGVKWASITGNTVDATPFSGDRLEKFTKELKELGFDEWGEEEMYDGITGQKIKVKIFVGVIYYERLHHLVSNKIHSRTRGPVQLLTAQPTEGRSREGGLRFGEMERDTLIGHGAVAAIRDRLLENSDKANIYVCRDCGAFAYYDVQKETLICPVCKSTNIGEVEMPYSFKLLLEEIKSLHIYPRLLVGKKGEEDE